MQNITSENLLTIRAIRSAAYAMGCVLNTPKVKNQAMILNFVTNATLAGHQVTSREINRHLGFSLRHTRKLISTAVAEGKLIANYNGLPLTAMRANGGGSRRPYTFTVGVV